MLQPCPKPPLSALILAKKQSSFVLSQRRIIRMRISTSKQNYHVLLRQNRAVRSNAGFSAQLYPCSQRAYGEHAPAHSAGNTRRWRPVASLPVDAQMDMHTSAGLHDFIPPTAGGCLPSACALCAKHTTKKLIDDRVLADYSPSITTGRFVLGRALCFEFKPDTVSLVAPHALAAAAVSPPSTGKSMMTRGSMTSTSVVSFGVACSNDEDIDAAECLYFAIDQSKIGASKRRTRIPSCLHEYETCCPSFGRLRA